VLRARVTAGETVAGAMVFEFFSPGMPQILHNAGCEFALFDMEHTGLGFETLKWLVAASRGVGLAPMVRVPVAGYTWLARALDVGAVGVMVPMVESPEQARAVVEATRYPPAGRRGAAFSVAHDRYTGGDVAGKIRQANAENLVIAQIESERGLDHAEAIAAVDGIDALWLGHFDLTNFLGIPGDFEHPRFEAAVRRVTAAARAEGKALGFMASDERWVAWAKAHGFNMIAVGLDQTLLAAAVGALVGRIRASDA